MKIKYKKLEFLWYTILVIQICLLITVLVSCANGEREACYSEMGGITLDFLTLPAGIPPFHFTVDCVLGIRLYDRIPRDVNTTSLLCLGSEEVPPPSGNYEDAAVILIFSLCHVRCVKSLQKLMGAFLKHG